MTIDRTAPIFVCKVGSPKSEATERVDQTARILQWSYEDDEAKEDKLTITVDNYDTKAGDSPLWAFGNIISVSWGYEGLMSPVRDCTIQEVTVGPRMQIVAKGGECNMNRVMKSRVFERMKRSEVVAKIAKEYGFASDALIIEDTAIVMSQVTQARMTDWQFIRDLARKEGFEAFHDFDGLHFHKRKIKQAPIREYVWFIDPNQGDLLNWQVKRSAAPGKPGGVKLKGTDAVTGEDFEVTAGEAPDGESIAPVLDVVDAKTETSKDVYREVVGQKYEAATAERTKEAAQREANGIARKQQMDACVLTLSAIGDPRVVAKSLIKLSAVGAVHSGNYYLTNAKHSGAPGKYELQMTGRRDGRTTTAGSAGDSTVTPAPGVEAPGSTNAQDPAPFEEVDATTETTKTTYTDKAGRT